MVFMTLVVQPYDLHGPDPPKGILLHIVLQILVAAVTHEVGGVAASIIACDAEAKTIATAKSDVPRKSDFVMI